MRESSYVQCAKENAYPVCPCLYDLYALEGVCKKNACSCACTCVLQIPLVLLSNVIKISSCVCVLQFVVSPTFVVSFVFFLITHVLIYYQVRACLQSSEASDALSVHFSVKDQGIGISAEDQKRLFKVFSQVRLSYAHAHVH